MGTSAISEICISKIQIIGEPMLPFTFGLITGYLVRSWTVGLVLTLAFSAIHTLGVFGTSTMWSVPLAAVGYGISRYFKMSQSAEQSSERTQRPYQQETRSLTEVEREHTYTSASIAHLSFLNAFEKELSDQEFAATALGAFDGVVQSQSITLGDVDMLAMGSAFALRRLSEDERMQEASPTAKGDTIGLALTDGRFDRLKEQAGLVAYRITPSLQLQPHQAP